MHRADHRAWSNSTSSLCARAHLRGRQEQPSRRTTTLFYIPLLLLALVPTSLPAHARDLSFEERVRVQEVIERIYYSHQTGASLSFEQAVPRSIIEQKVVTYLRESQALQEVWRTPITSEMLSREMQRIGRATKMPSRLQQLYIALDNDSFLIQECLARSVLARRLTRKFFAADPAIHRAAHERARALRERLVTGHLSPTSGELSRTVVDFVVDLVQDTPSVAHGQSEGQLVVVTAAELKHTRAGLRTALGDIGPLEESVEGYTTRGVLTESASHLRVAVYFTPKTTWDEWWTTNSGRWSRDGVRPVASTAVAPAITSCAPDDTWVGGALADYPETRYNHSAISTGQDVIIWGGYNDRYMATGARYDPLTDSWSALSGKNAPSPRIGHTAVWTGAKMLIWGGRDQFNFFQTGGVYDPVSDTWTPISTASAPSARADHAAVWTGSDMLVVGGVTSGNQYPISAGRYNLQSDLWLPMASVAGRSDHTAVWTGSKMLVFGGKTATRPADDGGSRYDLASNTWTAMSSLLSARTLHTAVWTGDRMIVWGGFSGSVYLGDGGSYDPTSNTWQAISASGAPAARFVHTAVWTGSEMIVWGGRANNYMDSGGRYSPSLNSWQPTAVTGAPTARSEHTAVWAGNLMIVWGGVFASGTGGRYDPVTDYWTPTATSPSPTGRTRATAVWTGKDMIVWGGYDGSTSLDSGAKYDPVLDVWTPTAQLNAPSGRSSHSAVWTGNSMFVWGGAAPSSTNTGALYTPISDTWSATSTTSAPAPRYEHSAIWTGSSMIVWGGWSAGNVRLGDGGRYDPMTDRWDALSGIDAPVARAGHSAVWAGDQMIIWGGGGAAGYQDTGGRYYPSSDSWKPISLVNAPERRIQHTAVWTGDRMVVWGGNASSVLTMLDTGGRYDPISNSWQPTSTVSVPTARRRHSAVWTGTRMVVWGGTDCCTTFFKDGSLYDPATDQWTAMSSGGPDARSQHSAVWTGSLMLVWGGAVANGTPVNSGDTYAYDHGLDNDGDGFSECAGDCDDADPLSFTGATERCDGHDNDCDGLIDNSAGPPIGPVALSWTTKTTSRWNPVTGAGGYDIVSGDIELLRAGAGDFEHSGVACLGDNVTALEMVDSGLPAAAGGFYYLARAMGCGSNGTYDSSGSTQQGSRDAGVDAAMATCP